MNESEDRTQLNPYAPTVETSTDAILPEEPIPAPRLSLKKTIWRWSIVCTISAIPSFFWGFMITSGQILGMLAGIATFIGIYIILDYQTAETRIRQIRTVRRTLWITYVTRVTISIIFPIAFYLDIACGMLVVGLMESLGVNFDIGSGGGGTPAGFVGVYVTTILQGISMNIVLAAYGALVYLVQWIFLSLVRLANPTS